MKTLQALLAFTFYAFGAVAQTQTPSAPATATNPKPTISSFDMIGMVSRMRTNAERMVKDMNGWKGKDFKDGQTQYGELQANANAAIDVCQSMIKEPAKAKKTDAATGLKDDVNLMIKSYDNLNAFYAKAGERHGGNGLGAPVTEIINLIMTTGLDAANKIMTTIKEKRIEQAEQLTPFRLKEWNTVVGVTTPAKAPNTATQTGRTGLSKSTAKTKPTGK